MNVTHVLGRNEDGVKFIKITLEVADYHDVSPCLCDLFKRTMTGLS
ncbi:hypothetical protein AGMMS50239_40810 [Bacteroidia bacterium]|nr:hypothetical protein AGMMS50239_40810 [Bacteroidia bacterium]